MHSRSLEYQAKSLQSLGQSRSVQRYKPNRPWEQEVLRKDIVRIASKYGIYGYRRITALLRARAGRQVSTVR